MAINYTTLLGLAQPVTGTEANTWGTVVNEEITALLDSAIAGAATLDVTSGNVTLTATAGVANQARMAILIATGTPGTTRDIIAPSQSKAYIVVNQADASVVLKGSATTGVTIRAGQAATCVWNGTDFESVASGDVDGPSSATNTAIAIFDGTTGKLIKNTGVTIDGSNNVSGVVQLNATTLDATNLEVTNLKAKDGTAAGSIADSTGVVTLGSSVLTTTAISGGTINNTSVGATTRSTGAFTTLTSNNATTFTAGTASTSTTTGTAVITGGLGVSGRVNAANFDGIVGANTAAAGTFTNLTSTGNTTLGDATADTVTINGTPTINAPTVITTNSTTNALRITQVGTGNALLVEDSANPDATPFVIESAGRVIIGDTTSTSSPNYAGTQTPTQFQSKSAAAYDGLSLQNYVAGSGGAGLTFAHSRSGALGTQTVLNDGDYTGAIVFAGSDGTNFIRTAQIESRVDGTPGTNDMPGRLVFSTTADGASSPTERMRIDSAGNVGIGGTAAGGRKVDITGTLPAASGFSIPYNLRGTIPSGATTAVYGFYSTPTTEATAFTLPTLTHFFANPAAFGAGSTVTNQYGFHAGNTLTAATNNYGFYSNIASGTGRWNFYAAGTAANYFAGNVGVGDTNPTPVYGYSNVLSLSGSYAALQFNSSSSPALKKFQLGIGIDAFQFYDGTASVERGRISNTGVWSLGGLVGAESLRVTPVASAVNYVQVQGGTTGLPALFAAQGSDTNVSLQYLSKGTGNHNFGTAGGTAQFLITHTASAVNYLQVTGAATGSYVNFSAQGSDANVGIFYGVKGSFSHDFNTGGGLQFRIAHAASAVNYLLVTGAATGNAATMSAQGSDTNIDLALTPKGTGNVRFGTRTANADAAITGYLEIKDSGGTLRKLAIID